MCGLIWGVWRVPGDHARPGDRGILRRFREPEGWLRDWLLEGKCGLRNGGQRCDFAVRPLATNIASRNAECGMRIAEWGRVRRRKRNCGLLIKGGGRSSQITSFIYVFFSCHPLGHLLAFGPWILRNSKEGYERRRITD
jgi:hypothetical protein